MSLKDFALVSAGLVFLAATLEFGLASLRRKIDREEEEELRIARQEDEVRNAKHELFKIIEAAEENEHATLLEVREAFKKAREVVEDGMAW